MTSPFNPDIVDAHMHLWDPRTTPRAVSPFVRALGAHPAVLRRVAQAVYRCSDGPAPSRHRSTILS